tara:strand:- start:168 stop:764 length:597 start_codon:yes stop_codon:yes gene_type:complete
MSKKNLLLSIFILSIIISISLIYFYKIPVKEKKINLVEEKIKLDEEKIEEKSIATNIIQNVKYSSKDIRGNEYIITAKQGEIDIDNNSVIFLKGVKATIILDNSNKIFISSDFGKYNINNFDTIFNENILINYLQNNIQGGYLDFSLQRNSMIISDNVVFSDNNNILKTDVVEIDIESKNTKFYMYDKNHKVSFKTTR